MTQTDRNQIYKALCACAVNLRGVARRLHEAGDVVLDLDTKVSILPQTATTKK